MTDNVPETMRAFVLTGHGDIENLVFHEDWPTPEAGSDEVLIKVHACGLNNTDVNTRTAWYSKSVTGETTGSAFEEAADDDSTWGGAGISFPRIQGADVAGTVVAAGKGADPSLIGKRVMIDAWLRDWNDPANMEKCGYLGSEADGGFADYLTVDHRQVHPVDCDLGDAELATFATSWVTAENMLNRARVGAGDRVLITGASGGVGSALIRLAERRGAVAIAMASADKHDRLRALGAGHLLEREPEDLAGALAAETGSPAVSVVADVVGGGFWPKLIDALERGGRYTCAGAIAGPIVEMDLRTFYLRDLTFTGATVAPSGTFEDLVGYVAGGEVEPMLAAVYPLRQLREAQTAFIAKRHIGNIVVTMD